MLAAVIAAVAALVAGLLAAVRRLRTDPLTPGVVVIEKPTDDTRMDEDGAVRSVQSADIMLSRDVLQELWDPLHLERLARTYWAFLTTCTLGLVRVRYTPGERFVTLVFPWLRLLTFQAPEYEMDSTRGIVRWRIDRGLLVAPKGRGGKGFLEIDVRRLPAHEPGRARVNVEVSVVNFYPQIARRLSRWVYENTQSRIHVIVTHGFLRRLGRRNLDESIAGRFASLDEVPDPQPAATGPPAA